MEKEEHVNSYNENCQFGWIKLYRSVKQHWLLAKEEEPFTQFEAWVYILLTVNHKPEKADLGGEVILWIFR